jgi:lactate dehydrogenase-like 2-hydroxyacid dehydrogenase
MSSGTDHLDKEALESRGIHYFNIPDLGTDATAEITVALLLAASRRLVEGHQEVVRCQSIFYPISRGILLFSLEIKEFFLLHMIKWSFWGRSLVYVGLFGRSAAHKVYRRDLRSWANRTSCDGPTEGIPSSKISL